VYAFAFLTMFGLVMTFTFDLLTSKSKQFIFVVGCTKIVTLKFSQVIYKIWC